MLQPFFLAVLCCILFAGCQATSHSCYFCEVHDKPFGSDCWNRTAETAQVVNCTEPCYTHIFQSGGKQNTDNYWFIKRGCSGKHGSEEVCEESTNCDSRHFGACKTCCLTNLCNGAETMLPLLSKLSVTLIFCLSMVFQIV